MLVFKSLFFIVLMSSGGFSFTFPPCFDKPCISYETGTMTYQIDDSLPDGTIIKISSELEVNFKISRYRGEVSSQPLSAKPIDTTIIIACEDDTDCNSMDGLNRHAGDRLVFYNDYLREKPYLDIIAAKHIVYQAGKTALFTTTDSLSKNRRELLGTLVSNFVKNLIEQSGSPVVYIELQGANGLILHLKLELSDEQWRITSTVEEGMKDEQGNLTVNFSPTQYEAWSENRPWRHRFLGGKVKTKRCQNRTVTSTVVNPGGTLSTVTRTVAVCWYEYK